MVTYLQQSCPAWIMWRKGWSVSKLLLAKALESEILWKLWGVCATSAQDPDTKLILTACCLCFFAFLRVGEMTTLDSSTYNPTAHFCYADVALDIPENPWFLGCLTNSLRLIHSREEWICSWATQDWSCAQPLLCWTTWAAGAWKQVRSLYSPRVSTWRGSISWK